MKTLQKLAGVSAIAQGIIYITAFTYFGAIWSFPLDASGPEKMTYLIENQLSFSVINFLMYVVFGCLLSVLVVGLHERLKSVDNWLLSIATVFGVIWAGLVIASGMLATVGLGHTIELATTNPDKAFDAWVIISVIVESIGGGNELTGGVWVLLISICALKQGVFAKSLNLAGLAVGLAGIATIYPDELFTEIFGVTQIIWFFWVGVTLFKENP